MGFDLPVDVIHVSLRRFTVMRAVYLYSNKPSVHQYDDGIGKDTSDCIQNH